MTWSYFGLHRGEIDRQEGQPAVLPGVVPGGHLGDEAAGGDGLVYPGQTLLQLELPLLVAGLDSVLHDPPIASCVL